METKACTTIIAQVVFELVSWDLTDILKVKPKGRLDRKLKSRYKHIKELRRNSNIH